MIWSEVTPEMVPSNWTCDIISLPGVSVVSWAPEDPSPLLEHHHLEVSRRHRIVTILKSGWKFTSDRMICLRGPTWKYRAALG